MARADKNGIVELPLEDIDNDCGCQPRSELCEDYVDALADVLDEVMQSETWAHPFPACDVFYDGERYILADGFHRYATYLDRNVGRINCKIHQGGVEDARWWSYQANKQHDHNGLRRTNADKRRALEAALGHDKAKGMSNRELADYLGISEAMVRNYRNGTKPEPAEGAHGAQSEPVTEPKPQRETVEVDVNTGEVVEDDASDLPGFVPPTKTATCPETIASLRYCRNLSRSDTATVAELATAITRVCAAVECELGVTV